MLNTKEKQRSIINRICRYILLITLVFCTTCFIKAKTVSAEGWDTIYVKNHQTVTIALKKSELYKKNGQGYSWYLAINGGLKKNEKIISMHSDNKAVKVSFQNDKVDGVTYAYPDIMPKRFGKATITVNTKIKKKKKTYKVNIRIIKYQNPYKKLTINGKNYKKKIDGTYSTADIHINVASNKKNRLEFQLKPNWKIIKKGYFGRSYSKHYTKKKGKYRKDFNVWEGNWREISILLKNTKTGQEQLTILWITNERVDEPVWE